MRTFDVIAAGLMVMDIIASPVGREVFERDTVYPDRIAYSAGGDALNVAINLAKLGAKVTIAGCVGGDPAGQALKNRLEEGGVDTGLVDVRAGVSTATSLILCDPAGERHFIYAPGANDLFAGDMLTDEALSRAQMLYVGSAMPLPGLENGVLASLMRRARSLGLITAMDAAGTPDPSWKKRIEPALPETDIFIPSLYEAQAITGEEKPEDAARYLRAHGVRVAGVKLGEDGCYIDDGVGRFIPAFRSAKPVDTTGAGDAFMAGFVRGALMGWPAEKCARLGCAMGASCIGSLGSTSHAATMESMLRIMGDT